MVSFSMYDYLGQMNNLESLLLSPSSSEIIVVLVGDMDLTFRSLLSLAKFAFRMYHLSRESNYMVGQFVEAE